MFGINAAAHFSSNEKRTFLPQLLRMLFITADVTICYDWLDVSMETNRAVTLIKYTCQGHTFEALDELIERS